jgi:hypothetical protein
MSNNANPNDFGILGNTGSLDVNNTLRAGNTEDTIKFTLPSTEDLLSSNDLALDKVDIIGYEWNVYFDLNQPVNFSLGTDSDSDGSFDQTNEIIGSQFLIEPNDFNQGFVTYFNLAPNPSFPADLLQESQTLFLDIESTNSNSSIYDLHFASFPIFRGNLTGEDDSYCCDGSSENKYYHDRLDEFSYERGTNISTGDLIQAQILSKSFDPVLFLLNQDTGEVIDFNADDETSTETIGADTFQAAYISFEVPKGTDNYVLSVESASANQQGEYFLEIGNH